MTTWENTPKQLWNSISVKNLRIYAQIYINILKATRIWDDWGLKHRIERKKKAFFPGNKKHLHIQEFEKFSIWIF